MSKDFSINKKASVSKTINFIALVLAILEIIRMVGFIYFEPNYLLLLGLMLLPLLISISNIKLSITYISFCAYLLFNIIITNPPAVFNSGQRLLLFIILLFIVSPMFSNDNLISFRKSCCLYFIIIGSVCSVASFFCYFLGINYFRNIYGITDYIGSAGLFGGLFTHSMFLGPMAGISTCFLLWKYLVSKKRLYILFCVLSAGATFFSASRAAVVATFIACVVLIILFYKTKGRALKFFLIAAIIGGLSFPLWESALNGINQKNTNNEALGEYGSRTPKFEARIAEFESNPLFGVGFASIDANGSDSFDLRTGTIEPGSSWLATLSMTGIIGFAFVAIFMFNAFKAAKSSTAAYSPLMASLVIWFAIHMIFEGYIFAAGGPLCFILWLVIGAATDLRSPNKTIVC